MSALACALATKVSVASQRLRLYNSDNSSMSSVTASSRLATLLSLLLRFMFFSWPGLKCRVHCLMRSVSRNANSCCLAFDFVLVQKILDSAFPKTITAVRESKIRNQRMLLMNPTLHGPSADAKDFTYVLDRQKFTPLFERLRAFPAITKRCRARCRFTGKFNWS